MGARTGCVLYPEMAIMFSASSMSRRLLAVAASKQPKKLTTWQKTSSVLMWYRFAYHPARARKCPCVKASRQSHRHGVGGWATPWRWAVALSPWPRL